MTAESAVTEKPRAGFFAGGADWLNPIVVKELRQAVQSRFVITALMVLLSIQLAALAIYLLASSSGRVSFDAGQQVFLILYAILLGVGLLFVPLYSAVRLAAERADTNVDLLFITTIKPRSIIAGKLLAAVVLTVLIFSACLPFMTLTYFLRGIDLPSIFVALLLSFAVVIVCTQAAIFVACLPLNRGFKALVGVGVLIVFIIVYFSTLAAAGGLIRQGVGSQLGDADFWQGAGVFLLSGAFLLGLFFTLAVALIMPLAANRALPVRLFLTAAWLFSGLLMYVWSAITMTLSPLTAWLIVFGCIFSVALFVAISERDEPGRRVLRALPQTSWKRRVAFFFFSGAANGLAWACLMFLLTIAVAGGGAWLLWKLKRVYLFDAHFSGVSFPTAVSDVPVAVLLEKAKWLSGMFLYFFCYALTAAALRRELFNRLEASATWVVALILLMLGSIGPFMLGLIFFFGEQSWSDDSGAWLVGNPFAWSVEAHRTLYATVGAVWAVLAVAFNLHWFIARVRNFLGARTSPSAID